MKKFKALLPVLLFLLMFLFTSFFNKQNQTPMLNTKKVAQIGIIVADIEKAVEGYSKLLGMEKPDIFLAENPADNPTTYKEKLTEGGCRLAFFDMENIQIELIQPVGGPSTWNDFLEETGGGIHHIAFWIEDMEGKISDLKRLNINEVQHGGWTGGQYSYLETPGEMGIFIELLENLND